MIFSELVRTRSKIRTFPGAASLTAFTFSSSRERYGSSKIILTADLAAGRHPKIATIVRRLFLVCVVRYPARKTAILIPNSRIVIKIRFFFWLRI